jgi:hypothetical protein
MGTVMPEQAVGPWEQCREYFDIFVIQKISVIKLGLVICLSGVPGAPDQRVGLAGWPTYQ